MEHSAMPTEVQLVDELFPEPAQVDLMSRAAQAAAEYVRRRQRQSHPVGRCDRGGRWWPDPVVEWRECCERIRRPSRAWPWSLMTHCRTLQHVAALYEVPHDLVRRVMRERRSV
jgi:hypothetical protein